MTGRVATVTGGTRGIGAAISEAPTADGTHVARVKTQVIEGVAQLVPGRSLMDLSSTAPAPAALRLPP
jgi:NAD(P)-dependent dehydrogenase (short-subunit alcohol dehydrogenase family)